MKIIIHECLFCCFLFCFFFIIFSLLNSIFALVWRTAASGPSGRYVLSKWRSLFFNTVPFKDADTLRVPLNDHSKMTAQFVLSYGHSKLMPRVPSTRSALWFLHSVPMNHSSTVLGIHSSKWYGHSKMQCVLIVDASLLCVDDAVDDDGSVVCRYGDTCYRHDWCTVLLVVAEHATVLLMYSATFCCGACVRHGAVFVGTLSQETCSWFHHRSSNEASGGARVLSFTLSARRSCKPPSSPFCFRNN